MTTDDANQTNLPEVADDQKIDKSVGVKMIAVPEHKNRSFKDKSCGNPKK